MLHVFVIRIHGKWLWSIMYVIMYNRIDMIWIAVYVQSYWYDLNGSLEGYGWSTDGYSAEQIVYN